MEIRILEYIKDHNSTGVKKGFVDFKVDYQNGKTETFRNVAYFEKDSKKWLSFPNVKRNNDWKPLYEREPSAHPLLKDALKEFEKYIEERGIFI